VDPTRFEGLVRKLSVTLSRRSLVGGSVGASVLAAVGLGEETLAKKHRVNADACIPTGKRCPAKKPRGRKRNGKDGKKAKKLSCDQCCQRRVTQDSKGQNICDCASTDSPCTESRECCDGRCISGICQLCQTAGESCNDFGGPGTGFCCSGLRCNQASETTSGVCVACLPDGATCNPDAPNNLCCGISSICDPVNNTCGEFVPCLFPLQTCDIAEDRCCPPRVCLDTDPTDVCCSLISEPCAGGPGDQGTCCTPDLECNAEIGGICQPATP
jgi:hypothetical protein